MIHSNQSHGRLITAVGLHRKKIANKEKEKKTIPGIYWVGTAVIQTLSVYPAVPCWEQPPQSLGRTAQCQSSSSSERDCWEQTPQNSSRISQVPRTLCPKKRKLLGTNHSNFEQNRSNSKYRFPPKRVKKRRTY